MSTRSNAEVRRISDQLFVLEQARWVTPDVTIIKAKSGTRVNLETVQRDLPPSTAILEYVMGDPHSYCLVITRASARTVALASSGKIDDDVVAYLKSVKAKQAASEQARALYNSLLRPVSEVAKVQKLVIVRDGQLHLLPFDGLVDAAGHYIAETKVVSYSASASTFHLLREQPRSRLTSGALLGVGAIPYDSNNVRRANATRGYNLSTLANLPESKNEVMAAAKAISPGGNTLLLGSAATESAFKREHLARYRVLHLAVHALANTAQPDRAALVMLPDVAAGEDGFLQASEVVHLKLNADLTVLSACDTAIGPIAGEEGIATLSRAFLLAGAKTVVSTLWSIEDLSSLVLMRSFYAHLATGMPADEALTAAKRDIIRKFGRKAPPYYWAAFTLEGAGDQTSLRRWHRS
jgi:CHAT domain-containing protein